MQALQYTRDVKLLYLFYIYGKCLLWNIFPGEAHATSGVRCNDFLLLVFANQLPRTVVVIIV